MNDVNQLIELALLEDLGEDFSDLTTESLFPNATQKGKAHIISKHPEDLIVCGVYLVQPLLEKFTNDYEIESSYFDGDVLSNGETLLTITASASVLLKIERTLLNFLRHLSGIATFTAKFVDKVKETPLQILDTRKTTPGFRHLEKYAVKCGGGVNHRMGLYDAIMIKDTHVGMIGGLDKALAKLPESPEVPVIVEVDSMHSLDIVLTQGRGKVSRVLLDNMDMDLLRECVSACKGIVETEASGNLNLETIQAVAATGVEYASVGMLTYAAGQVDLSMKVL